MVNFVAIDLFCGIGGLTGGLRAAGINVVAGVDSDASCQYTYEKNNPKSAFIHGDVTDPDILPQLKKLYRGASTKIIVGCAPCQPFSSHTQKNRDRARDSINDNLLLQARWPCHGYLGLRAF